MTSKQAKNGDVLFLWTYVMFLLLVATYFCAPIHHPNFYFQLTLGNWIRHNSELPVQDLWSAAGEGAAFYSDSWLFAAVVSIIEQYWGENGLLYAKLLLFVSFVGLLGSALSAKAGSRFVGASLTAVVAAAVFESSSLEPNVLGWALFFYCLEVCSRLSSAQDFAKNLSRLTLLLVLFVNVHASAYLAIGWILFTIWSGADLSAKQKTIAAAAVAASVLCTPYFGSQLPPVLGAFFTQTAHDLLVHPNAGTAFHFSIAFVVLLWVLLLLCLHQAPTALKARDAALAAVLTLAALMSVDYAPYAIIGLAYALAQVWGAAGAENLGNLGVGIDALHQRAVSWDQKGIIWVMFCLVIVNGVQLSRLPLSLGGYPIKALDYIVNENLPGPILTDSRFAPYVAYRTAAADGVPTTKPSVDPRTPSLNLELGNMMSMFERSGRRAEEFLNSTDPGAILCREESLLCELAQLSSAWELKFEWYKSVDDPEPLPQALRKGTSWRIYLPANPQ